MNFKAQVERDLTTVFHNSNEHADVLEFWISGTRYKGPVILDDGGAQDRKKPSTDHVDGLILVDLVMYVPLSLLKRTPKKMKPWRSATTFTQSQRFTRKPGKSCFIWRG